MIFDVHFVIVIIAFEKQATIAQVVERNIGNVEVTGPTPVSSFYFFVRIYAALSGFIFCKKKAPHLGAFFSEHYIRRITYFPLAVSTSYIPSAHFLFHSLMTSFSDLCPRCDCPSAVSIRSTWYCEPLSRSSSEALFTLVHFPLLSMLAALFAMRSILSNS